MITSDPNYYIYSNYLERKGFEVVAVPEDEHGLDTDRMDAVLERSASGETRSALFYVVTVNNPTCSILSNAPATSSCPSRHAFPRSSIGASIVFDKAYENLIHDSAVEKPRSGLLDDELGIVYEIGTLSKILAPAARIRISHRSTEFTPQCHRRADE